jgi:hypothetical protein
MEHDHEDVDEHVGASRTRATVPAGVLGRVRVLD